MCINNCTSTILKITSIFCCIIFFEACIVNEIDISSLKEEAFVPVTFSIKMDSKMFDSSSEIVPMQTKGNILDTYNVVKFTGFSTLVVLKKINAGWVIDKKIEDLYSNLVLTNTDNNALTLPTYELRPGRYRFILFANSKSKLNSIKENQLVDDPSKMVIMGYGSIAGTASLLGEELFIAKTGDWDIKRNDSLNQLEKRTVELNLKRVVAMVRMVMTTEPPETLSRTISVEYNLTTKNNNTLCSGVNLFGEMIKDATLKSLYGLTNVYTNPFVIDGRNFYFGLLESQITNRPRYFFTDEPDDDKPDAEYTIEITACDEIRLPIPIACPITLKRNMINGIVILKNRENYSCFEKDGDNYPVDFPSLPYSDYIELNNNL